MTVTLKQGSILDFEGDFIVNPANSFLRHEGGLAYVIANAAAPLTQEYPWKDAQSSLDWMDEQNDHPNIPTGGAGITSAGALPYKAIVHAVGPIWGGGDLHESELLYQAHMNAVRKARSFDHTMDSVSIAFPAISCGIFGYPVELAAPIAIRAAHDSNADVTFYLFEDEHMEAYMQAAMRERESGS